MNGDTFVRVGSDYASGHPFQTAAMTGTAASTNETLFTLANTATALVGIPNQATPLGVSSPLDPNANASVLSNQLGRPGGGYRGSAPYINSNSFDGKGFRVRAMGKFVLGAGTNNFTVKMYQGAAINASNLLATIPASGSSNVAAGSYNFIIEITAMWDSGSQVVIGEYWGNANNNYTARGALLHTPSVTVYSSLQFCLTGQFAVSNAGNSATLVEMSMEPC